MGKVINGLFRGIVFGVTGLVPGVSAGTIAIIMGFYNELIEAVNHFTEDVRKHIKFLLPLAFGTAAGLILFSSVIQYLLTHFSFPSMTFFIGLIVGGIPLIFKRAMKTGRSAGIKEISLILLPVIVLLIISNVRPVSIIDPAEAIAGMTVPFALFIFLTGIISGAALVVPGLSGSHMQLLFGTYALVTYSVSSVRYLLTDLLNTELLFDIVKVLVPLGVGMLIGGLLMARLIEKLLKDYHRQTYFIILGLLLGSVYTLFREPILFESGRTVTVIVIGIVTFAAGGIVSFIFGESSPEHRFVNN
jgi:putative membrane protein